MMKYANTIETLLIRRKYVPIFFQLSDEDAGKLIKTLLHDFSGDDPVLDMDDSLKAIYTLLVDQIDDGARWYIKRRSRRNLAAEGNGSARSSEADQAAPVEAALALVVDPVEAIGPDDIIEADSPAPADDQEDVAMQPELAL